MQYVQRVKSLIATALARGVPRSILMDPRFFTLWEQRGYHVLAASFYSPIPLLAQLDERVHLPRPSMPGIAMRRDAQRMLLEQLNQYAIPERNALLKYIHETHQLPHDAYGGADMMTLYCIIRHLAPQRVIEVGAGVSTFITGYALQKNEQTALVAADFTSIDPYPNYLHSNGVPGLSTALQQPVQNIPISMFESLEAGDVLFIDSTHISKVGSDVNYLILDVLPQLKPGVWVHFHDIFLPNDYPESWIRSSHRFWNEQYLLQSFLAFNSEFQIELATNDMTTAHGAAFPKIFGKDHATAQPGSFWISRTAC